MNHTNKLLMALTITAFGFATQAADKKVAAPAAATSQAGKYNIDVMHSKVGFEIPHLVISSVEGKFTKYEGEIELGEKFTDSKVTAKIDTASIDTSVADRDTHLKSADFFDVAKYPSITFTSKKVTGTKDKFKVVGDLTIKDKTKEVTLEGKFLGLVKDAYGNDKAAFSASTKVNRQEFGLKWGKMVEAGPVVGDEVTITLKVQGAKAK
jgi:polyisoprenoid-binding protein YceI